MQALTDRPSTPACKHCKRFFQTLHRRCTIHLNGECDCPVCQGLCWCTNRTPEIEVTNENFNDVMDIITPTRKFGEKP